MKKFNKIRVEFDLKESEEKTVRKYLRTKEQKKEIIIKKFFEINDLEVIKLQVEYINFEVRLNISVLNIYGMEKKIYSEKIDTIYSLYKIRGITNSDNLRNYIINITSAENNCSVFLYSTEIDSYTDNNIEDLIDILDVNTDNNLMRFIYLILMKHREIKDKKVFKDKVECKLDYYGIYEEEYKPIRNLIDLKTIVRKNEEEAKEYLVSLLYYFFNNLIISEKDSENLTIYAKYIFREYYDFVYYDDHVYNELKF